MPIVLATAPIDGLNEGGLLKSDRSKRSGDRVVGRNFGGGNAVDTWGVYCVLYWTDLGSIRRGEVQAYRYTR